MNEDMVRISAGMTVSFVAGAEHRETVEVPRAEWDAMSADERQHYLDDIAETMTANLVETWAYVEGEG